MAHVQQQIIDALEAVLKASGIVEPDCVFIERLSPVPQARLPALQLEESEEGETISELLLDGTQERDYVLNLAAVVQHTEGYGAQARDLGRQLEELLAGETQAMAPLLGLCAGGIQLASCRMAYSGDTEKAVAVRLHTWRFSYRVHQAQPGMALT